VGRKCFTLALMTEGRSDQWFLLADPKRELNRSLGARRDAATDFDRLGLTVALERLRKVPAYRRWVTDLERVMKELRFL
jgi:hypothetical protein